jgi:peptidoglycan/LPS O-acetylase OafA/YrhL
MDLSSPRCAPQLRKALPSKQLHRVVFLYVLRFIAAAAVLLQHSLERQDVLGVVLFVIPMTTGETFDLRRFTVRRIFRIYPLVLFAFFLVALAGVVWWST